ncbi:hypothetical protein NUACC21_16960 [Scytonema sp. NUACC21]
MKSFLVQTLWITSTVVVLASTLAHAQVKTNPPTDKTGVNNLAIGYDAKILEQPKSAVGNGSQFIEKCTFCNFKYPETIKQQGLAGTVEISLDADDVGNVTRVRLIRSSGHRELDDAAIEQVRKLKLAPEAGGRQGMRVRINYGAKGSV